MDEGIVRPRRTKYVYLGCGVFVAHSDNGHMWAEIRDFRRLRDALGPEILRAFCQCFVGTDHLRTVVHSMNLSDRDAGSAIANTRNILMLALLSAGLTREISRALNDLNRLGVRGMGRDTSQWDALRDLQKRWNTDKDFGLLRNKLSFHFNDHQVFDRGIAELCRQGATVRAFEADGDKDWMSSDRIGVDVALQGLGIDLAYAERVFGQAAKDIETLSRAIHEVFFALVEAKRT